MITPSEWIRCKFAASVEARIGTWGTTTDPDLGGSVYEYEDPDAALRLYEYGLWYKKGSRIFKARYSEIESVLLLSLKELVKVSRDPEASVTIRLKVSGQMSAIKLPLKVYSTLAPTLSRVVEELA